MFLVTGATGSLGRRIVRLLREREMPVRAFVRLMSNYQELEDRKANIFIGNLDREKDIAKSLSGIKYIISCHGSQGNVPAIGYQANIDLIDHAIALGIEHFVFISVLGSDRAYDDSPTFKAKREVEKYLESSSLNYTILRPSGFASSLIPLAERFRDTGIFLLIGDSQHRSSIISTDDLAKIAIDSCLIPNAKNQIFPIGGPEILKREDIPRILSRIFNKEPIIINPPLFVFDGIRNLIGLVNLDLKKGLGTLRVLLANEFYCTPEEVSRVEQVFDIKLETLETFLRRYMES